MNQSSWFSSFSQYLVMSLFGILMILIHVLWYLIDVLKPFAFQAFYFYFFPLPSFSLILCPLSEKPVFYFVHLCVKHPFVRLSARHVGMGSEDFELQKKLHNAQYESQFRLRQFLFTFLRVKGVIEGTYLSRVCFSHVSQRRVAFCFFLHRYIESHRLLDFRKNSPAQSWECRRWKYRWGVWSAGTIHFTKT